MMDATMNYIASGLKQLELKKYLQDPSEYLETLKQIVTQCLVVYPREIAVTWRKAVERYTLILGDTDLRLELRELKLKLRETHALITEYIDLAEDFPNIASRETENTALNEVAEGLENVEKVFDFEERDIFPCLASFLEEVKIRLEILQAKRRDIKTKVEELIRQSSDACSKCEKRAKELNVLKVAAAVGVGVVGGIFTGGVGLLVASTAATAAGVGAVGGSVAGLASYKRAGSTLDKHKAALLALKREFDAVHDNAIKLAEISSEARRHSKMHLVENQLQSSFIRPDTKRPPNLSSMPNSLRTLFSRLRTVNLENVKRDLLHLKTRLG